MNKAPVVKTVLKTDRVAACAAIAPSGWWMALALPAGAALWAGFLLWVM